MEKQIEKKIIKEEESFIEQEEEFISETKTFQKTNTLETYVVISVTASGAFTAATTFFTSIMISKYNSYNPSVNIPTLFLIISTFGFLYATLIFANNIGNLLHFDLAKFHKSRALGNALAEYLGHYFLMLSIPLIVNTISTDFFLRSAAVIMDLGGLIIYHLSGFSIMEMHFKNKHWIIKWA